MYTEGQGPTVVRDGLSYMYLFFCLHFSGTQPYIVRNTVSKSSQDAVLSKTTKQFRTLSKMQSKSNNYGLCYFQDTVVIN